MNDKNISFQISPPPRFLGFDYYEERNNEERKKYFLFLAFLKEEWIFTFWNQKLFSPLMVSDDNDDLINLFKTAKKTDIFTTSLENLQFKPDFLTWDDSNLNGLVIKDANQVQKSTKILYPEFTFKVIKRSEFKEMEGYKPENKLLELEIKPLDIGIEKLPKITKIEFYFFTETPSHLKTKWDKDKELNREEYEKLFLNAENKEFIIKPKKLIFCNSTNKKLGESVSYDTLKFALEGDIGEIKELKGNTESIKIIAQKPNEPYQQQNNPNSVSQPKSTNWTLITILGIMGIAIIIGLVIYLLKGKKQKT
ncbi:hypothetical protein [endosymbiont GvMRE of Glomus versiforme]|uniref:hypothetical protein n=1 Tax=endosymbiont GvMRE of Glomus versiforme TaxID=2039283 RepID=UPI000EB86BBB|nr:hypothetical protein [endosymbiont GvMRE of Glomus versiforme]RHZ36753.1 hypothetical protein GvMRE_I2g360 [endosymbiont GvMRE of Glomus versiforme]